MINPLIQTTMLLYSKIVRYLSLACRMFIIPALAIELLSAKTAQASASRQRLLFLKSVSGKCRIYTFATLSKQSRAIFTDHTFTITGGTGAFGNAVLRSFLGTEIGELCTCNRDEEKQKEMRPTTITPRPNPIRVLCATMIASLQQCYAQTM